LKYFENNLNHIEGLTWADTLHKYISAKSFELDAKTQKMRSQMFLIKHKKEESNRSRKMSNVR